MDKPIFNTPVDVIAAAKSLGASLKLARKRRHMTQANVALRLNITREVVINAEKGKPVTSHNLLSILWLYGLLSQMANAVSDEKDVIGLSLEKSALPERVRNKLRRDDDEF